MANVATFDLALWESQGICTWPGCEEKAVAYLARRYDEAHFGKCGRHYHVLVHDKRVYPVPHPREVELGRWEGEGGHCV